MYAYAMVWLMSLTVGLLICIASLVLFEPLPEYVCTNQFRHKNHA